MYVVVVGAGVAGLVTASGLRRREHQVVVYERKTEEVFATEGGAAIQLQVNAKRILKTRLLPCDGSTRSARRRNVHRRRRCALRALSTRNPSDPARAANLARTYQGMRRPRTDKVQHRARMAGMTWAIANPDQQRKRDDGLEALEQKKGRAKADENARPSSIAFEVWLEDYAALAEEDKALQDVQKMQARL